MVLWKLLFVEPNYNRTGLHFTVAATTWSWYPQGCCSDCKAVSSRGSSSVRYRTWKGGGKTGCCGLLQTVHKMWGEIDQSVSIRASASIPHKQTIKKENEASPQRCDRDRGSHRSCPKPGVDDSFDAPVHHNLNHAVLAWPGSILVVGCAVGNNLQCMGSVLFTVQNDLHAMALSVYATSVLGSLALSYIHQSDIYSPWFFHKERCTS